MTLFLCGESAHVTYFWPSAFSDQNDKTFSLGFIDYIPIIIIFKF